MNCVRRIARHFPPANYKETKCITLIGLHCITICSSARWKKKSRYMLVALTVTVYMTRTVCVKARVKHKQLAPFTAYALMEHENLLHYYEIVNKITIHYLLYINIHLLFCFYMMQNLRYWRARFFLDYPQLTLTIWRENTVSIWSEWMNRNLIGTKKERAIIFNLMLQWKYITPPS